MIPAQRGAALNKSIRGSPTTVYLHLLDELDPIQWREVKHAAIASLLDLHENTISEALNILTSEGYLERQPFQPRVPRLYRLVYSRMP